MMKTEIFDTASKITKAGLTEIGGRVAPKDSVLISMYATVGRPGFAHIPVATNQAIAWSVPNKKMIQPRFLLLVAQFLESEISSMARGATQRNINRAMLKEFSFNLPPLDEQKRIVDVVSSVDAYIAALKQQADSARKARNAVLYELLSAGGDDWTETTLGTLISLQTGKLDVNAGSEDGEFPFFTCARQIFKIDIAAFSGKSVLVAGNGDLNVKYYDGEFNAYQRTYVLQVLNEDELDVLFLFHFMDKYVEVLRGDTQGSTIQYLKKGQFVDAPINLPSLTEQKRIVEIVSSMDEVIQSTEKAVVDAKKLRSGLLSDLLSGDHEIPESYDSLLGAA
jgi:type I restriction enzyme S subunit